MEIPYLAEGLATATSIIAAYLYYRIRRPWWRIVIIRAVEYHRYHLMMIRNERDVNAKTRDLAYEMLMVLDRQFGADMEGSPGMRMIFRSQLGEKSTLLSLYEIFEKLYRDRAFTGSSEIDGRLERLFHTMSSMIYRYYMMTSVLAVVALLYMDLILILSLVRLDNRGSSRLFRDIAAGRA